MRVGSGLLGLGALLKRDWFVISALVFAGFLFIEAAGLPLLLPLLRIVRGWLLTWPPPDEHFALMVGDLGWPLAVLLVAWVLRRPLRRAAYFLAERMKTDPLKIGGFFEIGAATPFEALDRNVAATHVDVAPVAEDVDHIETLFEYAGRSEENAVRLLDWIAARHGSALDPEAFMTEDRFANDRHQAYIELVRGNQ